MNATHSGFWLGARRVRGIALALLLLALLAAGGGYLIHAATTTPTVTAVHSAPVVAPAAHAPNPAGEGHYGDVPRSAPNPAGEGHYPG